MVHLPLIPILIVLVAIFAPMIFRMVGGGSKAGAGAGRNAGAPDAKPHRPSAPANRARMAEIRRAMEMEAMNGKDPEQIKALFLEMQRQARGQTAGTIPDAPSVTITVESNASRTPVVSSSAAEFGFATASAQRALRTRPDGVLEAAIEKAKRKQHEKKHPAKREPAPDTGWSGSAYAALDPRAPLPVLKPRAARAPIPMLAARAPQPPIAF